MANRKQLPREPVQPIVSGGRQRPSRLVNLAAYPAVAQRQSANARLLVGMCGFGPTAPSFTADDSSVLMKIAAERFDEGQALLRRRALTALATTRSFDALESLSAIALSPVEEESVRATALAAVERVAPSMAAGLAMLIGGDTSPLLRVRARKTVAAVTGQGTEQRRRVRRTAPARDRS